MHRSPRVSQGYSSKPYPTSPEARAISGENGRSLGAPEQPIGSASGEVLPPRPVPQAHPVEGSVYNFFTWAEQIADFTKEVIGAERTALVANSIGTISALQARAAGPSRGSGGESQEHGACTQREQHARAADAPPPPDAAFHQPHRQLSRASPSGGR